MWETNLKAGEVPVKYTGNLKYVNQYQSSSNLQSPGDGIFSRNGLFYWQALLSVDGVGYFTVDQDDGKISYGGRVVSSSLHDELTSIWESRDGRNLYGACKGTYAVSNFSINQLTGELTYVDQVTVTASSMHVISCVTVSADGNYAYAGCESPSTKILFFARDWATGTLTWTTNYENVKAKGTQTILMSPDDAFVYAACSGSDSICWWAKDSTAGTLTYSTNLTSTSMDGVRHMAFSPDGNYVYSVSYLCDTLNVMSRDTATGALTPIQDVWSTSYLYYPYYVSVTQNNVYVAARYSNQISVFDRCSTDGKVTYKCGIKIPDTIGSSTGVRCIKVSPDNRFLVGSHINSNIIFSYQRMTEA